VIAHIIQSEGIRGLFVGYYATLVRDVPYTMMELGLYENMKSFLQRYRKQSVSAANDELAAAAVTGGITAFITTPLDLIKTKLMMQVGHTYLGPARVLM
jgi:solute carrier family 25 S-adenosylmethionine transporter 26